MNYQQKYLASVFKCIQCKKEFITTAFLYQKKDNKKCPICKKKVNITAREEFIARCREKYGDYYDYSLIRKDFKITDNSKIQIICPKHGIIQVLAKEHIEKSVACDKCQLKYVSETKENLLQQSVIRENDFKIVKNIGINNKSTIFCLAHGKFQDSECIICKNTIQMKQKIIKILQQYNIPYEVEKVFLQPQHNIMYDVYLPEYNLCIDCYIVDSKYKLGNFLKYKKIKQNFCEKNNIGLICIPHDIKDLHFLIDLINCYTKNRYLYTYDNYNKDIKKIMDYIISFNYKKFCIYGISRGGVIIAIHLSNLLQCDMGIVKYQRYDNQDSCVQLQVQHSDKTVPIFIVDDLISSTITMKKCTTFLKNKFRKAKIHSIVLFGFRNDDNIVYINEHPKKWIIFPWETSALNKIGIDNDK